MGDIKIETKDSHIRRIFVSTDLSQAEADSININRLFIELTNQARLDLEEAGFKPLTEVVRHINDTDPVTLKRTLAIECVGTKDE